MKPGRELDALVAERVLGWRGLHIDRYPDQLGQPPSDHLLGTPPGEPWGFEEVPPYSKSIAHAWKIVEHLRKMDHVGIVVKAYPLDMRENYTASVPGSTTAFSEGDSAPHAICLTALKALGVEYD